MTDHIPDDRVCVAALLLIDEAPNRVEAMRGILMARDDCNIQLAREELDREEIDRLCTIHLADISRLVPADGC